MYVTNVKVKFSVLGKFGVVHKGNLVTDEGNLKVVAIKTIKCKL